jgi:RNA polymerase sigma-70 factor (ECF subfamily)
MTRVAAGDRAAYRRIVDRHARSVLGLAKNVLGAGPHAEDIAQEALLRVWTRADRFEPGRAKLSTWLHRVVINLCIDTRRRDRPTSELVDVPALGPDALEQTVSNERQALLARGLAQLPVRQRAALTLFHFQERSGRECAEIMDLTEDAFESLLVRARAALRELTKEGGRS